MYTKYLLYSEDILNGGCIITIIIIITTIITIILFWSLQNLSYLTHYLLKVWNDNQLKSLAEIIIKVIFLMCEVL